MRSAFFVGLCALASHSVASVIPDSTRNLRTPVKRQTSCTSPTSVAVTFDELVTTTFGENIFVVGSDERIGTWNTDNAIALDAGQYQAETPVWTGTVNFPPGTYIEYKYIRKEPNGSVIWEADPNHNFTVPTGCATTANVTDTWQESFCENSPTTRSCWGPSQYSVDTDFDNNWPSTGKTVSYTFEITNITLSPDGFSRNVLAINGQYPGPTIYADWGDEISITVKNSLKSNGTGIHLHGMRQYHRNTQDGVPGLTECPIAPGSSKTYTVQATQYGTSWYHSHFSSQYGDGVLGPIVINGPATANYDLDMGPLPITDWYYGGVAMHASLAEHTNGSPPTADNGLINGTMTSNSGGSYARTSLTAGKKHRIRLVNTAVDNHFVVSLDSHQFTVIAADFVPIVPFNTTNLFIGIGQRYDIIVLADQTPGAYWFRADVQSDCGANFNNGNIRSIFSYSGFDSATPSSSAYTYTERCLDEQGLQPHWNSYIPTGQLANPTPLDTSLNQTTDADGALTLYWNVNGSSLNAVWDVPTLDYVRSGNSSWPERANVIELPTEGQWTYWVIRSLAGDPYNVQVPHPMHLHGHDFYVLGTGSSAYTSQDAANLNYNNPTRRDVAMLPANGWLALAFQTDNPGAWIMHCHIAWHADEGLAVQFLEAADQIFTVDTLPSDYDSLCTAWDSYYPSKAAYLKGDSGI